MIHKDGISTAHPPIKYSNVLGKINDIVQPDREWSTEVVNTYTCTDSSIPSND